ncbi:MAG: Hsp70 family protein [Proteobacteria bacterium]|nr:Hsp70 family protein [Pseudomonadota bacterium]
MKARYVVGIDLGTTNCAVACVDTAADTGEVEFFDVLQVVAPGELAMRPSLPSFLLLPSANEVASNAMALPWNAQPNVAVGTMARDRGAELPHRLVSSAKSWLSHTGVDRNAPILPWRGTESDAGASSDEADTRVSPVQASASYLAHIKEAWNQSRPEDRFEDQDIFLTVPASFDAVARELTVKAARQAGLSSITLLEEPQAAFYAWLGRAQASNRDWRERVGPGDVILVCDIGGGTTDFSLIAVIDDGAGNLAVERVAVGDHILLGGDNMDLALAHAASQRLGRKAKKLKPMQQRALVHACRRAKERLLEADPPDSVPVSILGSGSRLIGGTIRTEVTRSDVEALMMEGFFPQVAADASPAKRRTVGLRELGLRYAQDPAVTRHLAAFLARHGRIPSAVLYNGGVMKGQLLRDRIGAIVGGWQGADTLPALDAEDEHLDLAVAHGAAYYGMVRRGKGIRIRGGTARAYYIGVESAMPAIPGFAPPIKGLCVAPIGMEEGSSVDLADEELGLVVGETAEFRFFASSTRKQDEAGAVCDPEEDELAELDPVTALLPPGDDHEAGEVVPVSLSANVTEIGTLELWCVARSADQRWKLEYSVRDSDR